VRKTKYRKRKIVGSTGPRTIKIKKPENIHAIEVYDVNWTNYHKDFE